MNILYTIGFGFLGVLIVKYSLDIVGYIVFSRLVPRFVNIARRQLALYLHGHSYRYFQRDFAGRLAGKVIEMPQAMVDIIYILTEPMLFALILFSVSVAVLLTAHPVFALMLVVWIAIYLAALAYFIPRVLKRSEQAAIARSAVRGRFVDTLTNILTVKLFARHAHEDAYLRETLTRHSDADQASRLSITGLSASIYINWFLFWCVAVVVILHGYKDGWLSAGDVATVMQNGAQLFGVSFWLSNETAHMFQKLGEIKEGIDQITARHDIRDENNAPALKVPSGAIDIRNITFAYPGRPVFHEFSLFIKPGERIGLVGPSGAGKSTLTQLMLRLFDVQEGVIAIDGQSITSVSQTSLREQISVIPQQTDLLHRSIMDNIRYARPDAPREHVIAAAKAAYADEFIAGLRDDMERTGYDAHVGERGVRLSGGQRQRIAIARVILKNAPILILDEATSALDSESEDLIQKSLFTAMQGKTVIAIAHRLSTIAHMDRLIVLDQGRIVEDGPHETLLRNQGLYARLWQLQSRGFLKA